MLACPWHPGSITGLLKVNIYNGLTYKDVTLAFGQWNLPAHLFKYYNQELKPNYEAASDYGCMQP